MAARLVAATASMKHFDAVTGIVERAVLQSAFTGRPLRMPPILMVSPPGLGKTFYCRALAEALRTTCIPIAINGTSDRGKLGGLSPVWRGAKTGKIAQGLLVDSATAAPLYLLDEIDKPPALIAGENTLDVLLSALEPENARAFVDEYLDIPIDLGSALWLASANDVSAMPTPLLDRMLVVEVPWPDRDGARLPRRRSPRACSRRAASKASKTRPWRRSSTSPLGACAACSRWPAASPRPPTVRP